LTTARMDKATAEQALRAVLELVDAANAARARTDDRASAESQLESLFRTGERLAVYGSLAPGRQNHHIVQPLGGEWTQGVVEGDLFTYGWGAAVGYRALRPRPGAPSVRVHVLTSRALPAAWPELDAFEGADYRRVLVAVWSGEDPATRRLVTVANIYAAAVTE
jgi:gamma-glutamylcyclotransferase (GGCT)/AIG2-like uncharacterized protein YtfP